MDSDVFEDAVDEDAPDEATLTREGNDLMKLCKKIYSHTPETMECTFGCEDAPEGYVPNLKRNVEIIRLYLELLLEFIGLSPRVANAFRKPKGVYVLGLGIPALAYTVWSRIKFLTEESIKDELNTIIEESERNKISTESQTQVMSLTCCESCNLSQNVIKELVAKVEFFCSTHEITESSVLSTKNELRTKVHDVTNWEAMNQWCNALSTDIEHLTEISDKLLTNWRTERLKEKKKCEELENKLKAAEETRETSALNMNERVQVLSSENKQLKNKIKYKDEEINDLNKKLEKSDEIEETNKRLLEVLEQKNSELEEMMSKVKIFENSSISINEETVRLKSESMVEKVRVKELEEVIGDKITEINDIINRYDREMTKLNKRIEELEEESASKQALLNEQLKCLDIQERQITLYQQNELDLEEKLKRTEEIIASLNIKNEHYQKLKMELDNNILEEAETKENILNLQRNVNDLNEECELLKHELKKFEPTSISPDLNQ